MLPMGIITGAKQFMEEGGDYVARSIEEAYSVLQYNWGGAVKIPGSATDSSIIKK